MRPKYCLGDIPNEVKFFIIVYSQNLKGISLFLRTHYLIIYKNSDGKKLLL